MENLKVLVVEDEEGIRSLLGNTLSVIPGSEVVLKENALEALDVFRKDLLERKCFNLVFTDQNMPGMSGIDLAWRLRIMKPLIPIVLMSGDDICIDNISPENRPNRILKKPFDLDEIINAVEELFLNNR